MGALSAEEGRGPPSVRSIPPPTAVEGVPGDSADAAGGPMDGWAPGTQPACGRAPNPELAPWLVYIRGPGPRTHSDPVYDPDPLIRPHPHPPPHFQPTL